MTHADFVGRWLKGRGTEIGAFKTPIPGIRPLYVDKFQSYAGEKCLADFVGEADDLPFLDDSLDFVATSHVIEHVANPISALEEWSRVLRHGGIIYMVVPDKNFTWDRERLTTPVDHFVEDYHRRTSAVDATHIDEFMNTVVLREYYPDLALEAAEQERDRMRDLYHASVRAGLEINIHFHVFEPASWLALVSRVNEEFRNRFHLEVVATAERFPHDVPNGFLSILRVRKPLRHRMEAYIKRLARQDRYLAPGAANGSRAKRRAPLPIRVL